MVDFLSSPCPTCSNPYKSVFHSRKEAFVSVEVKCVECHLFTKRFFVPQFLSIEKL